MKKILRNRFFIIAVLIAAISMAFTTPAFAAEGTGRIGSCSHYLTVSGRKMHVVFYGELDETGAGFADGSKTALVMMPGLGVASPHIYFKPLAQELAETYNVVIAEPLGYGLSDMAGTSRTAENINAELKDALDMLGISKCVLAGHSISGIYGMDFISSYPEKVLGFISIDGTVYDDGLAEALAMEQEYMEKACEEFGRLRGSYGSIQDFQEALAADPEKYGASMPGIIGYEYSESDRKEYIQAYSRCANETIRDEISHMGQALDKIKGKQFPSGLPVLSLVSSGNAEAIPAWKTAHEEQLDLIGGKHSLYIVEGGHYIWYTNLPGVAGLINGWETDVHINPKDAE